MTKKFRCVVNDGVVNGRMVPRQVFSVGKAALTL